MSKPLTKVRLPVYRSVLAACLFAATLSPVWSPTAALADDMSSMKGMSGGSMPMGSTPAPNAAPANMPVKAPPAPAPVYQWTGCYVGVNGGGGGAGSDFTTAVGGGTYLAPGDVGEVDFDGAISRNSSNFLAGGQAGCNLQTGTVVYGLEGDYDYFRSTTQLFNNTNTLPVLGIPYGIGQSLTTDFLATVRPRLGIAADRNFGYITGGAAFTHVSYAETYADTGGGSGSVSTAKSLVGWTAGAGWEYAWTDHVLVRFEYLFTEFPKTSATGGLITGPGGANSLSGSASLVVQLARAGLSFKF